MKKNMGKVDRIVRLIIAAIAIFFYSNGMLTGTLGIVALVLALVFALTSFLSFCPLYAITGLSTCPTDSDKG